MLGAFGSLGFHKDNGCSPHECQRSTTQYSEPISDTTLWKMSSGWLVCGLWIYHSYPLFSPYSVLHILGHIL